MTRVLVLSWSAYGGGRARALLSLCAHLDANGLDVTVLTGARGWTADRLRTHHGLRLAGDWQRTDWADAPTPSIMAAVDESDPDVVVSFDTILNTKARPVDRPTVGYCRTQAASGLDEYWAPSKATAQELGCRPVYPIWYIEPAAGDAPLDDRPIDVMIHGRKANGAVARLGTDYNIVLANRFTYPDLRAMYRSTTAFVFPRPDRFEPLGLMPIEAAAHGCRVAVPTNSGVAECYPAHAYDQPVEHVEDALDGSPLADPVPESPTDPVDRLTTLA